MAEPSYDRTLLFNTIEATFSAEELANLCYLLHIDYDELAGTNKGAKIRELITFCERHGRIPELIARCSEVRPNANWAKIGVPKGLADDEDGSTATPDNSSGGTRLIDNIVSWWSKIRTSKGVSLERNVVKYGSKIEVVESDEEGKSEDGDDKDS